MMISTNSRRGASRSPDKSLEPRSKRQKTESVPLSEAEIKKLKNMEELLGPSTICMICDSNISKSIKVRDMSS